MPTDKLFTGQQRETTDGIYHYGARFYNADLGRFVQADSIVPNPGNPQDLNRYSYADNNPIRYSDPTGHCVGEAPVPCPPGLSDDAAAVRLPGPGANRRWWWRRRWRKCASGAGLSHRASSLLRWFSAR